MIWKLFSKLGGGSTRRWFRLHEAKLKKKALTKNVLKGPISLFNFTEDADAADAATFEWKVSDDSTIGGFSNSTIQFITDHNNNEKQQTENNNDEKEKELWYNPQRSFLRWEGKVDTRLGENTRADRSGFAALKSPSFNGAATFQGLPYNAIEVTCRTTSVEERDYVFNIEVTSLNPEIELYQNILSVPASGNTNFIRVISLLDEFEFFKGDYQNDLIENLEHGIEIDSLGLTLMDGVDGDFSLDIAQFRLINYYEDKILGEEDAEAPY